MHCIDVLRFTIKSVTNHYVLNGRLGKIWKDLWSIYNPQRRSSQISRCTYAQMYLNWYSVLGSLSNIFSSVLGCKILASKILSPAFIDSFDPKRQHNVEAKRLTYIMEYNSSLKIMSHCYLTLQTCALHSKCMLRCSLGLIVDQRFDDGCNCIRSTSNARSQRFAISFHKWFELTFFSFHLLLLLSLFYSFLSHFSVVDASHHVWLMWRNTDFVYTMCALQRKSWSNNKNHMKHGWYCLQLWPDQMNGIAVTNQSLHWYSWHWTKTIPQSLIE